MEVSFNAETRKLTIVLDTTDPTPSKAKQATGKGLDMVASTGGFILTGTRINGKALRVAVNAGI